MLKTTRSILLLLLGCCSLQAKTATQPFASFVSLCFKKSNCTLPTKTAPQHVATDTFKRAMILLKSGDTLKICDAKNAEKEIEFRYIDMPKRVKLIQKKYVMRVVNADGDIIFENNGIAKGQAIKPKLSAYVNFWGFAVHKMGEKEVNPYVFEKELVPNVREGDARRQSVHESVKKAQSASVWSLLGTLLILFGFSPSLFIIGVLGLAFLIGCYIAIIIHTANARNKYQKMIDDYNIAQGYDAD
jgi:hypothetical protein